MNAVGFKTNVQTISPLLGYHRNSLNELEVCKERASSIGDSKPTSRVELYSLHDTGTAQPTAHSPQQEGLSEPEKVHSRDGKKAD